MKKKIIAVLTIISMTVLLLAGCGDSRQTEEVLVMPKDEASEQALHGTEEQVSSVVQAPKRFETEISQDGVSITADAEIIIPGVDGFQLYQVEARPFSQEDYDRVSQVILQGGSLWRAGDKQAMDEFLKNLGASLEAQQAELEAQIAAIEEAISLLPEGSEQEKSILMETKKEYEQEMIVFQKESERSASEADKSVWVVVPDIVPENGELSGVVKVGEERYYVNLNNASENDQKQYSFEVSRDAETVGEYISASNDDSAPEGFSTEDIEKAARKLMEDIGLEDMELFGSEYVVFKNTGKVACCVHFTRVLQDIPVTYTSDMGNQAENYGSIPWTYERIDILFDDQGLYDFIWYSPYQLTKQSEEYVFLLPFSDIEDIFTKLMLEKYKDYSQPGLNSGVAIEVQEVRLGYMRVREDERERKGTMIPVWDFFGSRNDKSLMTINAMDGTIIDRELGY